MGELTVSHVSRELKCSQTAPRKHQEEFHKGEAPRFYMRVVNFYKTALSRQIGEAVRIDRRGGAGNILNSKSEYDRC